SIFFFLSSVRLGVAREAVQAIFPSFPAFFAQSPCSPANIVPAANTPAATSAMSLVIVEAETASAGLPHHFENRSQGRNLSAESPVPDFAGQPHRSVRNISQCE